VSADNHDSATREATPAHDQVPRWEHFPHQADIGIRGIGRSVEEAFEQAGMALTAVVVTPEAIQLRSSTTIECEASDLDVLFVDWLNAIVFEMATSRMLFGAYHVSIDETRLTATAVGEPVDPARHEPAVEIKGATYTALRVERQNEGAWLAQCVVDV
jgi:tRNA nucleotidyltransferase (CCA-adding enzyme)